MKPWTPDHENPQSVRIHTDLYFAAKGDGRQLTARMRSRIRSLSCRQINKEIEYFQQKLPDETLVETPTFRHTRQLLARKAHREKLSYAADQAIADQFVNAVPGILSQCRDNPELKYLDLLPGIIRERL